MKDRDILKSEATKQNGPILLSEYKKKRNLVKEYVIKGREEYSHRKLDNGDTSCQEMWNSVKDLLGLNKNLAPTKLKINGDIISNPKSLADSFNGIFVNKVKDLRNKTNNPPKIDPIVRLNNYLSKRVIPIEEFKLKPISLETLRKHLTKMKGTRSHGTDYIDSYSLKLSAPVIEEVILHLVNLSISSNSYPTQWKYQLVLPFYKKKET